MISKLYIRRFKSIKELSLSCRKINLFIGEPNSGKSNILETIGLLSWMYYGHHLETKGFIRLERTDDLFYDRNLEEPLEIKCDDIAFKVAFRDGGFYGSYKDESGAIHESHVVILESLRIPIPIGKLGLFKFYRFKVQENFPKLESDFLLPPTGDNLLSLLMTHKDLKRVVSGFFTPIGLRLGLRPHENKIEVIKQEEDVIISYPYSLTSETLQRLIFHVAAILTNKDSILAFEEPEAHSFPFQVNYLAELIAHDEGNNQFFISTHNPYLLLPILSKAPKENVAIFIVYYKNYETKVRELSEEELKELWEIDIFANLDRFLGE